MVMLTLPENREALNERRREMAEIYMKVRVPFNARLIYVDEYSFNKN